MTKTILVLLTCLSLAMPCWAGGDEAQDSDRAAGNDYQAMLEDAERARAEAEAARREAEHLAERTRAAAREREESMRQQRNETAELERERSLQRREVAQLREELSRTHRELREASRRIAQAHRDLARADSRRHVVERINLGDRAVIGVILGKETPQGVQVIGVSPDGPAERAGVQAGDVLVSIRGESLAGAGGRGTIYRVMDEAEAGEELALVVDRGGETWNLPVVAEQREPSSWQTLIRLPEAPPLPANAELAPEVIVEHIEVPDLDEEALEQRMQELSERLETMKVKLVTPEGFEFETDGDFEFPENFDVEISRYSDLAEQALEDADIWFGLPLGQGLELARINAGLGAYFKTDRGVLVLDAREDNAYNLRAGDVILDVSAKPVNSPADLVRALREIEPGSDVEIAIKRDRRDRTLNVTMPESRLGWVR